MKERLDVLLVKRGLASFKRESQGHNNEWYSFR